MSKENRLWMETEETAQQRIAQAQSLRKKVANGSGMSFEVFVTSDLAEWLLAMVEQGVFVDPSEAVFNLLLECHELEPHKDLRQELLRRRITKGLEGKSSPAEEVFARLREKFNKPLPETVVWEKIDNSNVPSN